MSVRTQPGCRFRTTRFLSLPAVAAKPRASMLSEALLIRYSSKPPEVFPAIDPRSEDMNATRVVPANPWATLSAVMAA